MTNTDDAYLALSNPYCRQILFALAEASVRFEGIDPLAVITTGSLEGSGPVSLRIELQHTQLPKLEEIGFIEYDESSNRVHRGPAWDTISPLLHLLLENRNELPEELR